MVSGIRTTGGARHDASLPEWARISLGHKSRATLCAKTGEFLSRALRDLPRRGRWRARARHAHARCAGRELPEHGGLCAASRNLDRVVRRATEKR